MRTTLDIEDDVLVAARADRSPMLQLSLDYGRSRLPVRMLTNELIDRIRAYEAI